MRTPFDCLGGPDVLVDKMIGNAYETVKYVALNLPALLLLANQTENLMNPTAYLAASLGAPGTETSLSLDYVTPAKVVAISTLINGTDGILYVNPPKLTVRVVGNELKLALASDAPLVFSGATVKIQFTFTP